MSKDIILVDDHEIFRNGLKALLESSGEYRIIAEASNGQELIKILENTKPDIILMDIRMPELNGVDTSEQVLKVNPELKILILSMFDDKRYYEKLIDIGVKGFILKDSNIDELVFAIEEILAGNSFFSQKLLLNLVNSHKSQSDADLTKRELEILQLIAKGLSTQEISDKLYISFRTVERHRANLLLKTNTNNSLKLLIFAIKHNLVDI